MVLNETEPILRSQRLDAGINRIDRRLCRLVDFMKDLSTLLGHNPTETTVAWICDALDRCIRHLDAETELWRGCLAGSGQERHHRDELAAFIEKIKTLHNIQPGYNVEEMLNELFSLLTPWVLHTLGNDQQLVRILQSMRDGATLKQAEAMAAAEISFQNDTTQDRSSEHTTQLKEKRAEALLSACRQCRELLFEGKGSSNWNWDLTTGFQLEDKLIPQYLRNKTHKPLRIHTEDLNRIDHDLQQHLRSKSDALVSTFRVFQGDTPCWVLVCGSVTARDETDKPTRMTGFFTDITKFKRLEEASKLQQDMQRLLGEFSANFLRAGRGQFDQAVNRVLEASGRYLNADRSFVFILSEDGTYLNNTHEWCKNGNSPVKTLQQNQPLQELAWYWRELQARNALVVNTDHMPVEAASIQQTLRQQNIKSTCIFAMRHAGEIIGFIGFNAMHEKRVWSSELICFGMLIGDTVGLAFGHHKIQCALEQSENRYRMLFDSFSDPIIVFDAETYAIITANQQTANLSGWQPAELRGMNLESLYAPESITEIKKQISLSSEASALENLDDLVLRHADGSSIPVRISGGGGYREDGRTLILTILRDVRENKQVEREKALALANLKQTEQMARMGSWTLDYARKEVICSGEALRMLCLPPDTHAVSLDTVKNLVHQDDLERILNAFQKAFGSQQTFKAILRVRPDGNALRYYEVRGQFSADASSANGTVQDVTEGVLYRNQLKRLAYYDTLTSLPNRVLLSERLNQAIARARRKNTRLLICILDIDDFKTINDQFGHQTGNKLLIETASRLQGEKGKYSVIARLGGDEFALVLEGLNDDHSVTPLLSSILDMVNRPVALDNAEKLRVSASLGATIYRPANDKTDADQLMRQAQQALYQAKLSGKNNYSLFDTVVEHETRALHQGLQRIRQAIKRQEFVLYYQPKVNMRTGAIIGAEALLRWHHPQRGMLLPDEFLPTVQGHSLAADLDAWVVETVLEQLEVWHKEGLRLTVSVNIGAHQLQQENFVDRLTETLSRHPDIPPEALELEVLESSAMHDIEQVSRVMHATRSLGISFALDDFGTGYSSLTYLKSLPASIIKIDQSFVRGMLEHPDDMAIIKGVLGMAKAFGMEVIAEGVETAEHGEKLLDLGCDLAQGFGISEPMPTEKLPNWVASWHSYTIWDKPVFCEQWEA